MARTVHLRCCEQPHRGAIKIYTHPIPPFRRFPPANGIVQGNCYSVIYERQNDINRAFFDEVHDIIWNAYVKRTYATPSAFYGPTRAESIGGDIPEPNSRTLSPNGTAAPPFLNGRAINCTVGDGFQDRPLPMELGTHNVRPLDNAKPDEWSYEMTGLTEIDGIENIVMRATSEESGIPAAAIANGEAGVNYGFRWAGWEEVGTNIWRRVIESWWDYYDEEAESQVTGSLANIDFGWEKVTAVDSELPEGTQVAGAITQLANTITQGLGTRDGWLQILERVFAGADLDWRDFYTPISAFTFNSFSVYVGYDPILQTVELPFLAELPVNGDSMIGVSATDRNFYNFRFDTYPAARLYNPNLSGTNSCPSKLDVAQVYPSIFEMPLDIAHPALFPCALIQVADYRPPVNGVLKTENLGAQNEPQLIGTSAAATGTALQRCLIGSDEIIGSVFSRTLIGKQVVEGEGNMRWYLLDGDFTDFDRPCAGNPFVFEEVSLAAFQPFHARADERAAITDAVAKKMRDLGDAYFLQNGSAFDQYETSRFVPTVGL